MQQDAAGTFDGPLDCARNLVERDGPGALLRGAGPAIAGYALAARSRLASSRCLAASCAAAAGPGNALLYASPLLALASVLATIFCACAVCPFEAVRILSVQSGRPGVQSSARPLDGGARAGADFRGIAPLLLKEVPFAVTRFVAFDFASTAFRDAVDDVGWAVRGPRHDAHRRLTPSRASPPYWSRSRRTPSSRSPTMRAGTTDEGG